MVTLSLSARSSVLTFACSLIASGASGDRQVKTTVKLKALPTPIVLSAEIVPPISSVKFLQMDKPSPDPPYFRVVDVSA